MSETSPAAVVILAAGEGTRMKSRTPKVLHKLSGRSLLGHAIAAAGDLTPQRLVVVVGHAREEVAAAAVAAAPQAD
ncbi:MAG TPA: NTP transferase domain-containing protein, partial [Trebonia sp.]